MTGLPLQSNCDPNEPEEHFLWALVGLDGPASTAPLVLPVAIMRKWSQRLWDLGFRHHPEEQKLKYVPPSPGANWVMGAAGRWVDRDTVLPPEQTAPDMSHLTMEEQRVLYERLSAQFNPPDSNPEPDDYAREEG